jgi:alpha-tubulin suppressor-like RCC1 family protein
MRLHLSVAAVAAIALFGFAPAAGAASSGQLYGSGYNYYGELGSSEPGEEYLLQPIEGLSSVTQASPSYYSSLAALSNGAVEASGYNYYGELGDGNTEERESFAVVPGVSGATSVAEGYYASFALLSNGTVDSWGYDYYGGLGNGETITTGCDCKDSPVQVKGVGGSGALSNVVAISAGDYDAVALLSNGTVVDWGYGDYGELGNGKKEPSDVPVQVTGVGGTGTLSNVVAISAGAYDNLALLSNGTVVAWGADKYGELGNGEKGTESDKPVEVKGVGGSGTLSGVSAISAGAYFNLALLSNGTVDSWGYGYYGELGDGNSGSSAESDTPVEVQGLSGVSAITAGGYFALALQPNGTLYGWGYGEDGELGSGAGGVYKPKVNTLAPKGVFALTHGAYNYTSFVLQGATASLSSSSVAFGNETVGQTSSAKSVTVKNEGPGAVAVSGDVLAGSSDFVKSSDTCAGATLLAGASCTVSFTFKPTATGAETATLAVSTSASNTLANIDLGGTGVAPAPILGAVTLSKSVFRAAPSGATVLAALATGTLVSYTDSTAATTTFEVVRVQSGVISRHGKSCGKPPKHPKGKLKRCSYTETVGSFSHADNVGVNSFRFTGRLHGGKLSPGSYRLLATAKSSSGKSATRTVAFKIVK